MAQDEENMPSPAEQLQTIRLNSAPDTYAPDGSEIRLLPATTRASMVQATLLPGQVSAAIRHRTVEEIWYVLDGAGEIWRKSAAAETIVQLEPGISISIPPRCAFQFRTRGDAPLRILIVTIPPWPGSEEAEFVQGAWS
jgi:mannose-6-phosphate isomerase-like protein (cupin superfamily)